MQSADPVVTYAGWVYKEGSLVKNWKKRFLVVKRHELAYYKTTDHESMRAQLLGAMRIARVERTPNITNGLLIHSMEGRQLKVFTDTRLESDKCYNAIAQWCHDKPPRPPQPLNTSKKTSVQQEASAESSQPIGSPVDHVRHAGWLEKQGQNVPTWKRRYFVLDGDTLTYSAHASGPSLARHRVVGIRRDRTRPFTLELTLDTARVLRVSAESEHELTEWQRVIRQTMQRSPAGGSPSPVPIGSHSSSPAHKTRQTQPSSGAELRQAMAADNVNGESWRRLFGADPNDKVTAKAPSFRMNIKLDLRGDNPSFVECDDETHHVEKPFSPTAPGTETIRKMRIQLHLMDGSDDEDEAVYSSPTVCSSSGVDRSGSPAPSRHTKTRKKTSDPHGPCCCITM